MYKPGVTLEAFRTALPVMSNIFADGSILLFALINIFVFPKAGLDITAAFFSFGGSLTLVLAAMHSINSYGLSASGIVEVSIIPTGGIECVIFPDFMYIVSCEIYIFVPSSICRMQNGI